MEIKAKCKYDYEGSKAISYVCSYKKKKPSKTMLLHIIFVLALALLALNLVGLTGEWGTNPLVLVICGLMVILELTVYFLMPRIQYNSMSKMKDISNDYIFRDEDFEASTDSEEYKGATVIKYSLLEKVMETGEYFFIFQNKRTVFLVDKATLEGGTAEELRGKLQPVLGKKYITCKY